jgi:hypothetical protein
MKQEACANDGPGFLWLHMQCVQGTGQNSLAQYTDSDGPHHSPANCRIG